MTDSGPPDWEAARAVAVRSLLPPGALRRMGAEWRGACPLCGAGASSKSAPFAVRDGRGWICHACQESGDTIALERALRGGTRAEAARRLAGGVPRVEHAALESRGPGTVSSGHASCGPLSAERARAPALEGEKPPDMRWMDWWARGRPGEGSIVEAWFQSRGLSPAWARTVRFAPEVAAGKGIFAPAMLAPISHPDLDAVVGLHVTYLSGDGRGKAALPPGLPARRMFGSARGAVTLAGLEARGPPAGPVTLVVGEGIETTASVLEALGDRPAWGMAVLSLGNLQGGVMKDRLGAFDADAPAADPSRPALTMAWDGPVVIAVDRDMKPVKAKVRRGRGRVMAAVLDGEARARICASVAVQHWRAAGCDPVRAIAPPPGRDFNDAWLEAT